jgi:Family of unknown function (DUF6152)
MTRRLTTSLLAVVLMFTLGVGSAWAHHNRSDIDMTKRVTLTGTLTMVDWRNPHIEFSLEAKGNGGKPESWSIESAAPSALAARGISKATFAKAIGQTVAVEVSTAKDGSRLAVGWKITFPDGTSAVMREA